jgi:hypothetical protein
MAYTHSPRTRRCACTHSSRLEQQSAFQGFVRDYRADVLDTDWVNGSARRANSNLRHGLGLPSAPPHTAAMGFHTDRLPQRSSHPPLLPSLQLTRSRAAQPHPASTGA